MNFIKQLSKRHDLTKGTPWKAILLFAIPIFMSTLLSNGFSLINALVLKVTVGGDSVTAINSTSSISNILFNLAYGCGSGFSVIAANKFGEKNYKDLNKTFYHSLFLSLTIGLIIMIVGLFSYKSLLVFLNIDPIYLQKAQNYYQIILFSFVFMLSANFLTNFLNALGNSLIPLIFSFFSTCLNISLAFLFTGVLRLDTKGVAIATLISNFIFVISVFTYLMIRYPFLRFKKDEFKIERKLIFDLLKIGLPLGFQWSILFVGSFVQAQCVNEFGELATKAVACYSPFESYLNMIFSVLATALLSFVGQNYGAKQKDRIKKGIKQVFLINAIFYVIILIVGFSVIDYVPYIFLPKDELVGENKEIIQFYVSTYLKTLLPFFICQIIIQMSRSCLQGIKKPIIPFISGIGELIARVSICLIIPTLINPANPLSNESYQGICFSTPIAWLSSVLIMGSSVIYIIFIKNLKELDNKSLTLN